MEIKIHRITKNGATVVARIDPNASASDRMFTAGRMHFGVELHTGNEKHENKEDTVSGFLAMDYASRVRHIKNLMERHLEQCVKEIST